MKIIKKSRLQGMQAQIRVQALAIKTLEEENQKQAERIAGLEALLYSTGVMDKATFQASDEERSWFATLMLERSEEQWPVYEGVEA